MGWGNMGARVNQFLMTTIAFYLSFRADMVHTYVCHS